MRSLLAWRFAAQGLAVREAAASGVAGSGAAHGAAARLAGLQAQDTGAVRLAVRARADGSTVDGVRDECARPGVLARTWLMRGTLHLVPARDLRWMLTLLGPRNIASDARRRAQLGLDDGTCRAALAALPGILGDGSALSRAELVSRLAGRGVAVDPSGQAPAHLMAYAAGSGVICRGPDLDRDEPGYVLLDTWVPAGGPALDAAEATARLARRYVAGYGPAGAEDFAAWSGLPLGAARRAFADLAGELTAVADGLCVTAGATPPGDGPPVVRLLGAYDTYLLGYRSRSPALADGYAKRIQAGGGVIHPSVVVDGRVAGRWRLERSRPGRTVHIEHFGGWPGALTDQLAEEATDLGRFLGEPVTLAAGG